MFNNIWHIPGPNDDDAPVLVYGAFTLAHGVIVDEETKELMHIARVVQDGQDVYAWDLSSKEAVIEYLGRVKDSITDLAANNYQESCIQDDDVPKFRTLRDAIDER